MHAHIVPLLAFLHMYVCLYVCNQSNQINQSKSSYVEIMIIIHNIFPKPSIFSFTNATSTSRPKKYGMLHNIKESIAPNYRLK